MRKTQGFVLIMAAVAVLHGCGGGGGSSDSKTPEFDSTKFLPESRYVGQCGNPEDVIDIYGDRLGSTTSENYWLRSMINDKYLWYKDSPNLDPATYDDPNEYFRALLSPEVLPNGQRKDRFSFAIALDDYLAIETGQGVTLGINWIAEDNNNGTTTYRVAYVNNDSVADIAGIQRGDTLVSVDSVNVADLGDQLFDRLYHDTANVTYEYTFARDNTRFNVSLTPTFITKNPVHLSRILPTPTGNVGYIHFTSHNERAEAAWQQVVNDFIDSNITDLVIDMRYNGGGRVDISSRIGYMVAGLANTQDKTFVKYTFNDKHTEVDPYTGNVLRPDPFISTSLNGQNLPSLNLNRVYVLTGPSTCSASELLMNSLRGIDVDVVQMGTTTCGKPYGFYANYNCSKLFFAINIEGENEKGFGDYPSGLSPAAVDDGRTQVEGCDVADDLAFELGDATEPRLAAALFHRENDVCPAIVNASKAGTSDTVNGTLVEQSKLDSVLRMNADW